MFICIVLAAFALAFLAVSIFAFSRRVSFHKGDLSYKTPEEYEKLKTTKTYTYIGFIFLFLAILFACAIVATAFKWYWLIIVLVALSLIACAATFVLELHQRKK